MESIWLCLCPSPRTTRILAMRGPSATIMKAHLSLQPSSPRAAVALLEAIALWEGRPVRAALVVDDSSTDTPSTSLYRDTFAVFGDETPLHRLEWVPRSSGARRRRDGLGGMGEFTDPRAAARARRCTMSSRVPDDRKAEVLRLRYIEGLSTRHRSETDVVFAGIC